MIRLSDTIVHDPFGMLTPGRSWEIGSGEGYSYGFNGKEQDQETYGNGNIYDYGFRIYNPRLGKFLSVDPLSVNYAFYSSYQFAGCSPIKFVDIDGLEQGELTINDEHAKIATLTWHKVYYVVNSGYGAVISHHKLADPQFQSDFKDAFDRGQNTIYINKLPVYDNDKESISSQKVKSKSKSAWERGNAWQLNIIWDVTIIDNPECTDYHLLNSVLVDGYNGSDISGVGFILDESASIRNEDIALPSVAAGTRGYGEGASMLDVIYLNDEVFGQNPVSITQRMHGANEGDLLAHEVGHNFGLSHPPGVYTYHGLMNNAHEEIKPTKANNIAIINKNLNNICIEKNE